MDFYTHEIEESVLLSLYENLLRTRIFEEKMLNLLRQNKISKWFSGVGQEAISVGAAMALQPNEYILPVHRNLGIFIARKLPLDRLFGQIQGHKNGYTKGRDRSFHFSDRNTFIHGMISHLATQLSVANGIALADVLDETPKVTLVFTGEGATSEGEFHEALNIASVWNLPVIFVVENNGYGLSTPVSEQYKVKSFLEKAHAYAIETLVVDGNNILEMYKTVKDLATQLRTHPKPVLIEAQTFRMRGHEEAASNKFVPEEVLEAWRAKDPLTNYEAYLLDKEILSEGRITYYTTKIKMELDSAIEKVLEEKEIIYDLQTELDDVFAPYSFWEDNAYSTKAPKRFLDAIKDAMDQSMQRHPKLVLMGQDIAEFGGVFKATEGLVDKYGKGRVRNTPLCESGVLGAAVGLSINGYKTMVEMQFADFVSNGFNQIVNNIAKLHYRTGINADVVVRMPTGGGTGAGPFHSQSNEAWFFKTPGLKIVYPSSPYDAKGLLNEAFNDPNPVMFFEHKLLYRSIQEEIPEDYYTLPLDKAKIVSAGTAATIITYGIGVHWALEYKNNYGHGIEILDLVSLAPIDYEAIRESISKTGKVLLLTEDTLTGAIISDIAAWISENMFDKLDAPIFRVGSLDTPVPFNKVLEENFLPKHRFHKKLSELLEY